jgi:dTDP-4-amino-4,6-dideoxygalactose transaminase
LPECTRRRAENAARLKAAIAAVAPGLVPLENVVGDSEPAYYKLGFRYDAAAFGLPRETFVRAMRGEGIAFDAGFTGLHVGRSPSRLRVGSDLKNATAAHDGCVTLHHSVLLGSADEIQQVADAAAKIHAFRKELA